jgi:oxepin-CoA hydrolase/3-oxo-5,6-dehydrosuberyl-CoA semialdehyde dehydrogenase
MLIKDAERLSGAPDGTSMRWLQRTAPSAGAFGRRSAHGYFVLSATAGLFVPPAPGSALANYGLGTLRFVKPVRIGDAIRARCKRKVDRQKKDEKGVGQGVVAWDVQVTNQQDELVAS